MSENMPQTLADVKAGDEVVMIYRTGRVTHNRSDDRVVRAVVTDAKRVNLTIVEQNVQRGTLEPFQKPARTWTIRRDTGTDSTPQQMRHQAGGGMYGWHAYTAIAYERMLRQSAASRTLRRHGIRIDSSSPWYDRKVELADLLTQYADKVFSYAAQVENGLIDSDSTT